MLGYTQEEKPDHYAFNFKNTSYHDAIALISEKCSLNFIYSDDNLPIVKKVNFESENATVDDVLKTMFKGKFLDYKIIGSDVIIVVKRIPLDSKEGRLLTRYPINGFIRDITSNETVIGATIYLEDLEIGTVSNFDGFYSISVPKGKYLIKIKSLGFQELDTLIDVTNATNLSVSLDVLNTKLREVVILSSNSELYEGNLKLSNITAVSPEVTNELPMVLGQSDIIKSLQLMPGFKSPNEGSSELSVRGGATDQNLFLIDNVPIYNATHSLGFYSIFNTSSIKNVNTYKGGIPAQYGGRASSVVDVHLKEGNSQRFRVSGGVGTISANLTLEGPIKKDKASFIISGRRPYTDLLQIGQDNDINTILFYDVSSKFKYQINQNNTLTASSYFSRDRLSFQNISSSEWGNNTGNISWSSLLSPRTYSDLTLWYTIYDVSNIVNSVPETSYRTTYQLNDYGIKYGIEQYFSPFITLKAGIETVAHVYNQGSITPYEDVSIITPTEPQKVRALESSAYMDYEWNINNKLKIGLGVRYSRFDNIENEREYIYDVDPYESEAKSITSQVIDTVYNSSIKFDNNYQTLDPRLSLSVAMAKNQSFRVSFDRMTQYSQELSLSNLPSNSGVWIPSDKYIAPLINNQISMGYLIDFKDKKYDFSIDSYYKTSHNVLEFKPNGRYVVTDQIETDVISGEGRSYGIESIFRKRKGKLTGSLAYTYSFSFNMFDDINNATWYPTNQDQRHVFNVLTSFQITPQLQFSAVWNYASGRPYTAPIGKYYKDGFLIPLYGDKNSSRLPSTHHLDISLTFYRMMTKGKKNESSFNFSIYNIYARKNTYSYIFRSSQSNPEELEAVKVYLFSILPSFSYNFKF
ncbi:TonB-dependent receptor [Flammeovirga kamogawensis]|uniref:TonB-dependent receptor n=1 Tax=Flammeovirga kamogawensis TaxID=373891 RepID=A0ABX8GYQ0_9BACT|nr:TonB-dependent receptor [Flammeovirga kamogawensis]MBB6459177.1 hypothetical protein [Flammeovirga kamogawensis]QWG08743.1 TonB-dependent receptor [Flammeovirga kamogawensis]TRX67036.1 hypothetical protein EO216_02375 [Flammeovirga kamogawensis]